MGLSQPISCSSAEGRKAHQAFAVRYSETTSEVWRIGSVRAGQDGPFENRVRVRHGAGREESLCLAAVARFHRIPGVQIPVGASLSGCVRSGVERRAYPRGSGGGFVSFRGQPADSANDPSRAATHNKDLMRETLVSQNESPVLSFPLQL